MPTRSGICDPARRRAPAFAIRRAVAHAQLRLRSRLLGARGDRRGQARIGVDFKVEIAPPRAGDPARIVAAFERARQLDWRPRFDDLATIVGHALAWERELLARRDTGNDQAGAEGSEARGNPLAFGSRKYKCKCLRKN